MFSWYVVLRDLSMRNPGRFAAVSLLCLLFLVFSYVLLFRKMGTCVWWALLPFVNEWKLYRAVWGSGYFSLFQYVPYIGAAFRLVMLYKTGRAFEKEGAAMVFVVLLPTIARYWLALGRSAYIGPEGRPESENPYSVP